MTTTNDTNDLPDANAFGKLIQAYRRQHGWSQKDLADHWGFTREYVSQIERGIRKLEKYEQIARLADILEIPEDKLEAAGKTVTRYQPPVAAQHADDALLEALLIPAEAHIKFSWLLWHGDETHLYNIEGSLYQLIPRLEEGVALYHGQFSQQMFRILAYAHEMLGKIANDHSQMASSVQEYQKMYDFAEEIGDTDLLLQATMHQADMFRRRGMQQNAYRRMEAAKRLLPDASLYLQGVWHKLMARNHYTYGNLKGFQVEIALAEEIAYQVPESIDAANNDFNLLEVLQEKGQGYTMLWQPEKALEIYKTTDQMKPFRPKRDLGSYTIIKAQAHCVSGDLNKGIDLAEQGIGLATSYHSNRHVTRLRIMSDRLGQTKLGLDKRLKSLSRDIYATLQTMKE